MARSHARLCRSTGSLEMFVFHTLSAGNIAQLGAPGTVTETSGRAGDADGAGVEVAPAAASAPFPVA
jgi:hypothetical protein